MHIIGRVSSTNVFPPICVGVSPRISHIPTACVVVVATACINAHVEAPMLISPPAFRVLPTPALRLLPACAYASTPAFARRDCISIERCTARLLDWGFGLALEGEIVLGGVLAFF